MRGLCGPGSVTPAKSRCLQKSRLCRGFSDPWTVASGTMQSWEPRPVAWDPGAVPTASSLRSTGRHRAPCNPGPRHKVLSVWPCAEKVISPSMNAAKTPGLRSPAGPTEPPGELR